MKIKKNIFLISIILIFLFSNIGYAVSSFELALENPAYLSEIEDQMLLYFSYSDKKALLTYVEYDQIAAGYGALTISEKYNDNENVLSYIGSKEIGSLKTGVEISKIRRKDAADWLLNLGLIYDFYPLSVRTSLKNILLTDLRENKVEKNIGFSVYFNKKFVLGTDAFFTDKDKMYYRIHLLGEIIPNIKSRLYYNYDKTDLNSGGLDVWLQIKDIIFHSSYNKVQDNNDTADTIRVGIGKIF